jgi:hypothetical protein
MISLPWIYLRLMRNALWQFNLIFRRLGIPLAPHKTIGPCYKLEYLGIELDTVLMQARLPIDKLDRIRLLICTFLNRRTCTKREILSLLGHLNFACRVIVPGRTFISRLIGLSNVSKNFITALLLLARADKTFTCGINFSPTGTEFQCFWMRMLPPI